MNPFTLYAEKMMKSFEEIPRDYEAEAAEETGDMQENVKEVQAVQNIKGFLNFVSKEMKGTVTEEERKAICEKKEKLQESIEVLRTYLANNDVFKER